MPIIKNKNQLNERITFCVEGDSSGPEPTGGELEELFSCWCYVKGNTIRDIKENYSTLFEGTMNFVIRYRQREEINNTMQIKYKDKLHNIVAINADGGEKEYIVIIAKVMQ